MNVSVVVPGIWRLEFAVGQAYLCRSSRGLKLIDTGTAGAEHDILAAISELGMDAGDLREIVATHYHDDHRGSLAALSARLPQATAIAHRLDAPVIRGDTIQPPPKLTPEEQPYFDAITPGVPAAPPAAVQREVEDGAELETGGVIVHVPGHTPGSIAALVPELGALFTGDTIAAMGDRPIMGVFNLDREAVKASIRRLAALEFDVGCFGHGAPVVGNAQAAIAALARSL